MTEIPDSSLNSSAPAVPPPPAAPQKNTFARLAGALFAPGETFEDVARKPDILLPLLIFIIIGYITTIIVMPRMDFESILNQQREAMQAQNPQMKDSDFEPVARMTRAFATVMGWIGPLIGVLMYVIIAAIFLLAFRLFGGTGTFQQALSATLYAWVPLVLFSIVMTIVVLSRGTFDPAAAATIVKSNPAFLVSMKEQPVLFSLLSSFDIFTIWTLVLLSFGYSAMSKLSRAKSAVIVFALYFAWVFVKVGFAALGAARMKA
jgi:hypothetical protein